MTPQLTNSTPTISAKDAPLPPSPLVGYKDWKIEFRLAMAECEQDPEYQACAENGNDEEYQEDGHHNDQHNDDLRNDGNPDEGCSPSDSGSTEYHSVSSDEVSQTGVGTDNYVCQCRYGFCCWDHAPQKTTYQIDLKKFERYLNDQPIFTRRLLEEFEHLRNEARSGRFRRLMARDLEWQSRYVWFQPDEVDERDSVHVNYLSYTELCPDYEPERHFHTNNVVTLQRYNEGRGNHPETPGFYKLPIFLSRWHIQQNGKTSMEYCNHNLASTKPLWDSSNAARRLREKFVEAAESCEKIKKIVCFGLGNIEDYSECKYYHQDSAIQHLGVLIIAAALEEAYRAEDPDMPPIEVVFQDPAYTEYDKALWSKEGNVKFVDDPSGFLAVDESTLVVAAFVSYSVPVLSICADVVSGGPAGILFNKVDLVPDQKYFCTAERVTPKVVKLLLGSYEKCDFLVYKIERELKSWLKNLPFWLWGMDCFLKPKSKSEPNPVLMGYHGYFGVLGDEEA